MPRRSEERPAAQGNRESKVDQAVAVAGGQKLKGSERKRLLWALAELSTEDGPGSRGIQPKQADTPLAERPLDATLGAEDERLVTELRAGLAELAGLSPGETVEGAVAVRRALDGAEFVVRGDLLTGQSARLPQLLPSFVFLVLLPLLGKPEALRVAERAARLLDPA
jgi:hypothetical protein